MSRFPACFVLFLPPAFVDIISVFALWAAKFGVGTVGGKYLVAMFAGFQRAVPVCQHETEHHLQAPQQGMKIPYDRRLVQQRDVVGGSDAAERRHPLTVEVTGHFVQIIIVIVVEKTGIEGKGQILELLCQPVISFGILPLEAHAHRLGRILHSQGQSQHCPIPRKVPLRFRSFF